MDRKNFLSLLSLSLRTLSRLTNPHETSYPSVTNSAPEPIYTGPSVESVADQNANSSKGPISGGKLGAAVGVPLLVVAIAVIAYVGWNRMRKRPEKKRFSAVSFFKLLFSSLIE